MTTTRVVTRIRKITTPTMEDMNLPHTHSGHSCRISPLRKSFANRTGGICLMFDISLLLDVSQNQFVHGPTTEEKSTVPEGSKSALSRENVRGRLPTLPFYASSRLCSATFLLGRQFKHQGESHRS